MPRWGAGCLDQSPPWRCGGGTALEAIANLELRLEEARRASQEERERARRLEKSMARVLQLVREWPTGPMPLALERLVSGTPGGQGTLDMVGLPLGPQELGVAVCGL